MLKSYPMLIALIFIIAQGCMPARSAAQDTRNQELTKELHLAYNQLQQALQDRPEALDLLEQTQLAWLRYHSLDTQVIAALPFAAIDQDNEEITTWRANLMKQHLTRLREDFTNLPKSDRLKAHRSGRLGEYIANHPDSERLMEQGSNLLNAQPGDDDNKATSRSRKEPRIKADKALNEAYGRVTSQLYKAHPDVKRKLIKSQLAWIKYRDLDASFTATRPSEPQLSMIDQHQQALESLTVERTVLLQRMFEILPAFFRDRVRPPGPAVIRTLTFDNVFRPIAEDKLPAGVLMPSQIDFPGGNGMFCYEVDLNHDNSAELIVCYGGGSGGMGYIVYQKKNKKYEQLGTIFGFTLNLLTPKNGFDQIGTSTKSGAGDYDVDLYQYANGQYRLVRTDSFNEYRGYHGTK